MTIDSAISSVVGIDPGRGWRRAESGQFTLWHKTYGVQACMDAFVHALPKLEGQLPDAHTLEALLPQDQAHFAVILQSPNWTFAAVDPRRDP